MPESEPDLCWRPLLLTHPDIPSLQLRRRELARVQQGRPGEWHSTVGMHLSGDHPRLRVIAPSMRLAQKWAEQWCRRNLARIEREIAETPRPRHVGAG